MLQSLFNTHDSELTKAAQQMTALLAADPTDTEVRSLTREIYESNKRIRENIARYLPSIELTRQVKNMDWKTIFTLTDEKIVHASIADNHVQLKSFALWLRYAYSDLDEDVIKQIAVKYLIADFNNTITYNHGGAREYNPITIKELLDVFDSTTTGTIYNKDGKEMKPTRANTFADIIVEYAAKYVEDNGEKPTYREFTKYLSRHYMELDNKIYRESHIRSTARKKNLTDYFTADQTKNHTKVKVTGYGTVTIDASLGATVKVSKDPADASINITVTADADRFSSTFITAQPKAEPSKPKTIQMFTDAVNDADVIAERERIEAELKRVGL